MAADDRDRTAGFRLGPWRVEPALNRLVGLDRVLRVEPRVMDVLVCLARHAGEVVTRREIESAVWGQAIVSDQTITNAVSELRRLLGDSRAETRFIETIPKRGYRLLGIVEPLDDSAPAEVKPTKPPFYRNPFAAAALATVVVLAGVAAIVYWAGERQLPSLPVNPLTSFVGTEWTGSWSPDGSQLAVMHTDSGSADISVMTLGSGDRRPVANSPFDELTPRWSPDGRRVAYLSDQGRGIEVFWVAPTGGPAQRVARTGIPFLGKWMGIYALGAMPWSPDGRTLVYSRADKDGRVSLFRIDLAGGASPRRLTDPPADAEDWDAAWSPDGHWIAFSRFGQDGVGIWRVPAAGGDAEAVLADTHTNRGPSWSPDGERLVFYSNRGGPYNLWVMSSGGSRLQPLTAGPGRDYLPVVSQAGRTLFTRWDHQTDLYWLDPTDPGKEHTRLTFNTRDNYGARVASDGQRIAYHSDRSGNLEIWVLDRSTGEERRLTDNPAADLMPDWSPDGKRLVFLSNRDGVFRLYAIDADGTGLVRLSDHVVPLPDVFTEVITFGSPRWSPDGSRIGFVAPGEAGPTLWLLDPSTGGTESTGFERVLRFDWYVDSSRVVYLDGPDADGAMHLLAADLVSGESTELLSEPCAELDVAPDGSTLMFVRAPGHFGMNLYRLPLVLAPGSTLPQAAGEPVAMTVGEGVWHVHGGAWSPNGTGVVYTRDLDNGDLYSIETAFQ